MRRGSLPAGAPVPGLTPGWMLVLTGEARLETARAQTLLRAGDAILLDDRAAYRLTAVADSEVVHADLRHSVSASPLPSPFVVPGFRGQHPGVASLVSGCPIGSECRATLFAMSYAGLIGAAMTSSWVAADGQEAERGDSEVADVVAAVTARPGEPWTLDLMADLAHLSRSALTDRFRRTLGRSPMETLREVRMQRARTLLDEQVPVTRVAFDVGYGSVAAFSRAFAARHGSSPQSWRSTSPAGDAEQCPHQAGDGGADGADEQGRTYAEPVEKSPAYG